MSAAVAGLLCAAAVVLLDGFGPGAHHLRRRLGAGRRLRGVRTRRPPAAGTRPSARIRPRLRRRLRAPDGAIPTPLVIDLVSAAVEAGIAPSAACRALADALRQPPSPAPAFFEDVPLGPDARLADDLERIAGGGPPLLAALSVVHDVLTRARRTGMAPAAMLRRAAEDQRREHHARSSETTNRLPVLLVLPAGLCLLPAALLLGVAPIVLDLLSQVLG